MNKCEFYNVEMVDGYFSGVVYIYEAEKRFIVEMCYDVEYGIMRLRNCLDHRHNSYMGEYSPEELEDIKNRNYYDLRNEILLYIETNGDRVYSQY